VSNDKALAVFEDFKVRRVYDEKTERRGVTHGRAIIGSI